MPHIEWVRVRAVTPSQAAAVSFPALKSAATKVFLGTTTSTHMEALKVAMGKMLWAVEELVLEHTLRLEDAGNVEFMDEVDPGAQAVSIFAVLAVLGSVRQARGLKPLQNVHLRRLSLTPAAVAQLVQSLPGLKRLEIRWVHLVAWTWLLQ